MQVSKAIVREVSSTFTKCVSSHPSKNKASVKEVRAAQETYIHTLKEIGLDIIKLDALNSHPDACFVEDTAIIFKKKALISRLGALSRRGEELSIAMVLNNYFSIKSVVEPGTIEGGDVIHTNTGLISGLTTRTNSEGVNQMSAWFDIPVNTIEDNSIVHLKSYVTYLDKGFVTCTQKYSTHPNIASYQKILIPKAEEYAANTLMVNGHVILPSGFPETKKAIQAHGFDVLTIDAYPFQLCEGALTCLSLLF